MGPKDFIAVAAIDFGTTFSGWALSFRHNFKKGETLKDGNYTTVSPDATCLHVDPASTKTEHCSRKCCLKILEVETRNWHNGESITLKTSTAVLVQPDGVTLEGFGYKAEDRFQELVELDPKEHKGYFFFKRFKMVLFRENNLTRKTELIAENGKRLPAIRVFKLAIEFLKDDALGESKKRFDKGLDVVDVHWALTVPAIWKAKAKNFMREAAVNAGIPDVNLTIVLEPEAASIYCQNQPLHRGEEGVGAFKPGTKYIVLDCGGGTIDISCHEIMVNGKIREIHRVKGNDLGGTCVDMEFANLLKGVFGKGVWNRFEKERAANFVTFFRSFETKKRDLDPTKDAFNVTLPVDLYELYEEENNGKKFKDGLPMTTYADKITIKPGSKVQFKSLFMTQFLFGKSMAGIVKCVKEILDSPGLESIKHMLLVGGYGESMVLQKRLKEEFPSLSIVIPQEAGLAVLIGAVHFGYDTTVVKERMANYTYGTRIAVHYDSKIHSKDQIKLYDGVQRVLTFKLLVKCNECIGDDHELDVGTYHPVKETQKEITFPIYAVDLDRDTDKEITEDDDYVPEYANDKRCTEIGKVTAKVTNFDVSMNDRKFNLKIMFGKTEIEGVVTNKLSNEKSKASIDLID